MKFTRFRFFFRCGGLDFLMAYEERHEKKLKIPFLCQGKAMLIWMDDHVGAPPTALPGILIIGGFLIYFQITRLHFPRRLLFRQSINFLKRQSKKEVILVGMLKVLFRSQKKNNYFAVKSRFSFMLDRGMRFKIKLMG